MSLDAMKQALEALEFANVNHWWGSSNIEKATTALRLAIEQAERQELDEPLGYWNAVEGWVELPEEAHKPVAWVYPEALEAFQKGQPWTAYGTDGKAQNSDGVERIPLYTAPRQREWAGLTDEEFSDCLVEGDPCEALAEPEAWTVMREVEAKLREKNAAPPQREPLTEAEIDEIWRTYLSRDERTRAIERKHGIGGGE